MPNPLTSYLMMGKLVALLGVIAIICFQASQIHKWHMQSDGNARRAELLQAKLDAISSEKNAQQIVTRDRIINHTRIVREAEKRARQVEQTKPVQVGQCKTPAIVMETDI